jgi:prepilin peptidase CpaA
MALTQLEAWWLFPLTLPLCLYVAFTDMREMRITNQAVILLALVFVVAGPFLMSFDVYLWRLLHLVVALVIGMILNAAGAMGAGDSKFLAAAAPYVALADLRLLMAIFAAVLLAAFVTHRAAKASALRKLAPHWTSWEQGKKFPMGLALGCCLSVYLGLGVFYGATA